MSLIACKQVAVVRRSGEGEVEVDVGVRVQGRARRGLVHTLDGVPQGGDLLGRCALRRQACELRLDHHARLDELLDLGSEERWPDAGMNGLIDRDERAPSLPVW